MPQIVARPFTSRTYVALSIARGIAAAHGHADLTECHVALGVLREGENPAVAILHRSGVALRALRRDLESALPELGHPTFGEVVLPATPGELAVVKAAEAEAHARRSEYIGNEHLLLALLRGSTSPVGQLFARHGVTYDTALTHLHAVRAGE